MCTIFDPLGILNLCILELKLIVQELWRWKKDWGIIVPKDLLDRFNKFQNDVIYLENIEFIDIMALIAQQKQPNYIYLPIHQIKHTGQLHTLET